MKKPFTLILVFALALGALSLSLGSCQSAQKEQSGSLELQLGTMPSVDALPFEVALGLGIYDSLGLKLTLVPFTSPNERDVALQAGALEASITDYTSAIMQHHAGLPLQLLMPTVGRFALLTAPEAGITSLASLQGKRIALSSNTVIDYATDRLLQSQGIGQGEVTRIEVQKIPLRLEMLRSHQVDAAVLPQPFAERGLGAGLSQLSSPLMQELQLTGVVVRQSVVEEQAEALRLLIEGYRLAIERIREGDPTEWMPYAQKALGAEAERIDFSGFSFSRSPEATDIETARLWLAERGLISEGYTAEGLIVSLP